jgi:hypothetical protein
MTEDEAITSLRGIKHQMLAIFKTLEVPRIYLLDDTEEPVVVILHAGEDRPGPSISPSGQEAA